MAHACINVHIAHIFIVSFLSVDILIEGLGTRLRTKGRSLLAILVPPPEHPTSGKCWPRVQISEKIRGKIHLVTLRTMLDTHPNFHTFRQEFEHASRNTAFFSRCNSEDGKCELHMHSFVYYSCLQLLLFLCGLHQLMP